MIKQTIKYTDYNGVECEEDFFFNLSKAEIIEMQLSEKEGLDAMIKKVIADRDTIKLLALFKTIILKSFGVKSDDGKRFIKKPELTEAFEQSEAYSELFTLLVADTDAQVAFIKGVMPDVPDADVDEEIKKLYAETNIEQIPEKEPTNN